MTGEVECGEGGEVQGGDLDRWITQISRKALILPRTKIVTTGMGGMATVNTCVISLCAF